jgi:hypothetical protein
MILSAIIQLLIPKMFFKRKLSEGQIWGGMKTGGVTFSPRDYFRKDKFVLGYTLYLFALLLLVLALIVFFVFVI